jgi:hypothetical protein
MSHPHGGEDRFESGNRFRKAYERVGRTGFRFATGAGEEIRAFQGQARDGVTPTIVFRGDDGRLGSVCEACWGYRQDCNRLGAGKYAEMFDRELTRFPG